MSDELEAAEIESLFGSAELELARAVQWSYHESRDMLREEADVAKATRLSLVPTSPPPAGIFHSESSRAEAAQGFDQSEIDLALLLSREDQQEPRPNRTSEHHHTTFLRENESIRPSPGSTHPLPAAENSPLDRSQQAEGYLCVICQEAIALAVGGYWSCPACHRYLHAECLLRWADLEREIIADTGSSRRLASTCPSCRVELSQDYVDRLRLILSIQNSPTY